MVDVLESTDSRKGMNLTMEVRDGIINHTGGQLPFTLEGQVVKLSDRIAYINHDIDDALRSGVISLEDIPSSSLALFGRSHRERIDNMVNDVVRNSDGKNRVSQSSDYKTELDLLRTFMFANVYKSNRVKREEDLNKVDVVLSSLYDYFLEHVEALPEDLQVIAALDGTNEAVKDYHRRHDRPLRTEHLYGAFCAARVEIARGIKKTLRNGYRRFCRQFYLFIY